MIAPHGGKLTQVRLLERVADKSRDTGSQVLPVSNETAATLTNLATGVLSPLKGFMIREDYQGVLDTMRLADDTPWTIPILLHVPSDFKPGAGDEIALTDRSGAVLAVLGFEERYKVSRNEYAEKVFGTTEEPHPGVAKIQGASETVIAGDLRVVFKPKLPFEEVTLSPTETRVLFRERGWKEIVAFQTRNAPHISHEYLQKTALSLADGIFVNPVIGKKKPGDFTDEVIVDAYKALIQNYYPVNSVVLSVLHYEMQYAGPREAIMHAIMRKNFGCTRIAIGRDHAGVGNYYKPYAAQEIFKEFPDLGITPLFFREFFHCKKCAGIANEKICPHGPDDRLNFSGTKLREIFSSGQRPPKEFMRPEVVDAILNHTPAFVE